MADPTKNRREFCRLAVAAAASPLFAHRSGAQVSTAPIALSLDGLQYVAMPRNFTGLSYEMPQLYNPRFFSSENRALVHTFRNLAPHGVLRLGGNLSDVTRWQGDHGDFSNEKQVAGIEHGKSYWEWKLTDTSVREHRDGAITPAAIRSLRTFLDATGWDLIYGLCFGSGSPERAADEAACVFDVIGPRLLAFQIGNEDDFFGGNRWFRERGYNFDLYLPEYREYVAAVRARTPKAQFAGPDVAANMGWVQQFAEKAGKPIVFLSAHHYAMGPAKDPAMNADRLLNAKLHAGLTKQNTQARAAVEASGGVPFRMTEGNSCYGGGKPEVSDAFASALWVADYMLSTAAEGYCGVNLHGGGDGIYTPIETVDDRTAIPRPMFYGMQMSEQFSGGDIARIPLNTEANIAAYASRQHGRLMVAVLNKGDAAVTLAPSGELAAQRPSTVWKLQGPSIAAKTGVTFSTAKHTDLARGQSLSLPAYSGLLIQYGRSPAARP